MTWDLERKAARLLELKSLRVSRCRAADLITWRITADEVASDAPSRLHAQRAGERVAAKLTAELDAYFRQFAFVRVPEGAEYVQLGSVRVRPSSCIGCGAAMGGLLGLLGGGFQWGLVHGEGACATCAWPARGYHRPLMADGTEAGFLSAILCYHPVGLHLSAAARKEMRDHGLEVPARSGG